LARKNSKRLLMLIRIPVGFLLKGIWQEACV